MVKAVFDIKVIIFGTGRLYIKYKKKIKDNVTIVAFCDNDRSRWGEFIDGVVVLPPDKLLQVDYDCIFILTVHAFEIRKQLNELGVDMLKVYDMDHIELLIPHNNIQYIRSYRKDAADQKDTDNDTVVLFTHALNTSGANVVLLRAALLYREIGYNVVLFSRDDGELRDRYLEAGMDVYIVTDLLSQSEVWKKALSTAVLAIVNTFWFYYLLQEMDEEYKAKAVWWIHETFPYSAVNRIQFETCVRGLKTVAVVSPKVDKITRKEYGLDEMIVLPWGIPERRQSSQMIRGDKIVFSMIGSLNNEIKGQDIFLKAIQCLPETDREKSEFWIIGAGDLGDDEAEIADKYECIKVLGFIEQEKIPSIYARSNVIVCASRQEALSVVVVEAFMNEKLAIVSDAAGIVDYMVPGEDGFIFPSGDHNKLADYMHWAINHRDEASRIGRRSRRVYDKNFTLQVFKEKLERLI